MKFLHTSDWHVGKAIRGRSRAEEHREVFAEITALAKEHAVDFILVAGDLFETAAPTALSEKIVYETLLALSEAAPVVAIAGNHDNPRRLQAVAPLLELGRVTMATEPRKPADGGVLSIKTDTGETAQIALVPFVSQRSIVRADALMSQAGFENAQSYTDRMNRILQALCSSFDASSVNIVLAHAFVNGGTAGGGERPAHLVEEYAVSSLSFPASASYVALGHLHGPQKILGPTAIHYCGSPLQLDFGEEERIKQVNIVEAAPGLPAKVEAVPLSSGRGLRTLRGTYAQLQNLACEVEDAWLRVCLDEPYRVGLADEVRELLGPGVVDVRLEQAENVQKKSNRRRDDRSPKDLFSEYLEEQSSLDSDLVATFVDLYDEVQEVTLEQVS